MTQSASAQQSLDVTLVAFVAAGHGGVPRYARALASALDRVAEHFDGIALTLLTNQAGAEAIAPRRLAVRLAPGKRPAGVRRLLAEQIAVARTSSDVVHFFDLHAPLLSPRRPFTATVHDALVARGYEDAAVRRGYARVVHPRAVARARALVAVSGFARDEAVHQLGADPGHVHVVRSGPGLTDVDGTEPSRPPPSSPFLLYVGGLAPNKGLPHLVRGFARSGVDARLELVGRPASGFGELQRVIAASGLASRIGIVTDATDADVDRLYRAAVALAAPSEYEGFGFTPLEAMARGCPVVASDIPAIREIAGAGALLLPPRDEEAWANAIGRVFADEQLRDSLRERGLRTVASYSWERTARQLCGLLLAVGREGRP